MTNYYTALGVLRVLLVIFIIFYLCSRKLRNKKMSTFQVTVVGTIMLMQVLQAVYQMLWNGEVTDDCETQSRNVDAAVDSATYLIGMIVSYFLFKMMNMIYKFSIQGSLPKETQRKRMTNCIIITFI